MWSDENENIHWIWVDPLRGQIVENIRSRRNGGGFLGGFAGKRWERRIKRRRRRRLDEEGAAGALCCSAQSL